jgi:LytS/YehU family sensor histidine kinase
MRKYSKAISLILCVVISCLILTPMALAVDNNIADNQINSRVIPCDCGGILFGPFSMQCYCPQRWRE